MLKLIELGIPFFTKIHIVLVTDNSVAHTFCGKVGRERDIFHGEEATCQDCLLLSTGRS